jgi:hypothetical protein
MRGTPRPHDRSRSSAFSSLLHAQGGLQGSTTTRRLGHKRFPPRRLVLGLDKDVGVPATGKGKQGQEAERPVPR